MCPRLVPFHFSYQLYKQINSTYILPFFILQNINIGETVFQARAKDDDIVLKYGLVLYAINAGNEVFEIISN